MKLSKYEYEEFHERKCDLMSPRVRPTVPRTSKVRHDDLKENERDTFEDAMIDQLENAKDRIDEEKLMEGMEE